MKPTMDFPLIHYPCVFFFGLFQMLTKIFQDQESKRMTTLGIQEHQYQSKTFSHIYYISRGYGVEINYGFSLNSFPSGSFFFIHSKYWLKFLKAKDQRRWQPWTCRNINIKTNYLSIPGASGVKINNQL